MKYVWIGVAILIIAVILFFILRKPKNESEDTSGDSASKNNNGSNNTDTNSVSNDTAKDEPLVDKTDDGGWTINGNFVSNQYPKGSDNIIPSKTTYANDQIAATAYAGDFSRAIQAVAGINFPNTTNRTKLYEALQLNPAWSSLQQKIKNDPRIDVNVKGWLLEKLRQIAWDGILLDAQGSRKTKLRNGALTAAKIGLSVAALV